MSNDRVVNLSTLCSCSHHSYSVIRVLRTKSKNKAMSCKIVKIRGRGISLFFIPS